MNISAASYTKTKNLHRKIKSAVASICVALALLLCGVVLVQVLSRGYVSICGYSLFRVVTGSMEPTIPTGSVLISEKASVENIQVGDIVCFRSQSPEMIGKIITHRVVEIIGSSENKALKTKGDANTVADGNLVTETTLIGKVVWFSKEGNIASVILGFFSNGFGFFSFILIPAMVVCGFIMRDSVRSMKKQLRELNILREKEDKARVENSLREILGDDGFTELCEQIRTELRKEMQQQDDTAEK